jgi:predicted RND superfamily exporter protein
MSLFSSLRHIQLGLFKLHRSGLKKSKFWLIGLSIVVILSTLSSSRLKMLLSIDDLIDPDFHTYKELTHLNTAFSDKNDLLIVVSSQKEFTQPELCGIQKWIYDDVNGHEPFRKMFSAFGVRKPIESNGSLSLDPVLNLHCEKDLDDLQIRKDFQELQKSPWGSILTSKTGNDIAMNFYLNDDIKASRYGSFDVAAVGKIMESFNNHVTARFPSLQAHYVGVAPHEYYLKKGLDQTAVLNLAIPLIVLILFWFFFANIQAGILFVGTITFSSLIIYGMMAAFGCPLDILTNTLILMLVLSSLEDFLFIVHHNRNRVTHWRQAFRRLLMPGFFTSLTTAIGFASLYSSDLAIIRRFGVFAAVAALLEWAMVFLALPALLQRFPRFRSWLVPRRKMHGFLEKLATLRLPRLLSFALISTYLISALGMTHLQVSDAPASIFPSSHVLSHDLDYLAKSRGWESQVSLVFSDSSQEDRNQDVIAKLSKQPNVVAVEDPYTTERYLTEGLTPGHAQMMRNLWRFAPANSRLNADDGTQRSLLYLEKTDTASIEALLTETRRLCPKDECHLAGTLISYTEFGDRVLMTLLKSLGLSLILVSLTILYLLYAKGQGAYLATVISAMWGPISLVCIFWVFKLPVTYVTCTVASILVGLAGDNTIQYLFASRKKGSLEDGVDRQAAASVQVCLMMTALSAIFFGSYFASVRTLAPLFMLGFLLTLIGDLFVFRGLISRK